MKKIAINGDDFEYKIFSDCDEYNGPYCWTEFYQGVEIKSYKKYLLLGPIVTEASPKFIFKVWMNIESPHYTKQAIRAILLTQVELLYRKQEIERGEII